MDLLRNGLTWLDQPGPYTFVGWLGFALTVALAAAPGATGTPRGRWSAGLFGLGVVFTLIAFRWPAWFSPDEFNPDESQIIAGAITLKQHLLYWKYVDGGTHGPLSEYLLVLAAWLGAPLNHATARCLATLLQAGSLIAAWRALRAVAPPRVARFGILPALAFWSFNAWLDFLHYGTELPGIFLIAAATWALARPLAAENQARFHGTRLFLGGGLLALVPLAKLQLVPLSAACVAGALVILGVRSRRQLRSWWDRPVICFGAGLLLPWVLLGIYLTTFGLAGQFWQAYVRSAFAYSAGGHHPLHEMPSWFFHFSATAFVFAWFFWGSLSFALLYTRTPGSPASHLPRLLAWGAFGLALYCVLRPSREVAHYLHILVMPLTLLCGVVLAAATADSAARGIARAGPWVAFMLLTLVTQIQFRVIAGHGYAGNFRENLAKAPAPAAEYLLEHRRPGDALAMWGWEPALFVETGLPQGTREAATPYLLMDWPMRSFYIDRYKEDLVTRKPTWFVDAVGPGAFVYEDRQAAGHETIAAIREIVDRDYEFVADLGSKRIYRLKALASAGTP